MNHHAAEAGGIARPTQRDSTTQDHVSQKGDAVDLA
jgi:hypothetical protein